MNITAPALTFPTRAFPTQQAGAPTGLAGELVYSELMGKYATLVKAQKVFYTSAIITAPVIFSTAGQLGPMLWNRPGSGLDAHILAMGLSSPTTAATAPTSPTAITAVNCYAGGGPSQMGAVNSAGTVIVLPAPVFLPLTALNTGAVSVLALASNWVDIGGGVIVGPGNVGYVCGSATLSTGVLTIAIVWAELAA